MGEGGVLRRMLLEMGEMIGKREGEGPDSKKTPRANEMTLFNPSRLLDEITTVPIIGGWSHIQ